MANTTKYARKDSVTGKGMNEGFCFGDGDFYCESEEDAITQSKKLGYNTLNEAYEDEAYYFTNWEVEEGENWFNLEGKEFTNCHDCENETQVNEYFYFCTHCLTHL